MALATKPGRLATSDDIQETTGWLRGIGTLNVNRHQLRYLAKCIGPQRANGVYWSGYWRETYTVTDVAVQPNGAWAISVKWHGDAQCANPGPVGRTGTHCTAWNMQADRIVRQPDEPEEICGASITFGGADPSGSECDLPPGHQKDATDHHEGPDPFGASEYARVRWLGGGHCGGDRLVTHSVEFFIKED